MDKLEKRYSNLINELNVRKSLLSDHELRHLKDLEIANKRKLAGDQDNQEIVIETAVDYEDKCLKQLQSFSFAERKLSTDVDEKNIELKKRPNVLKTLDRVLDKKLILITYDPERSLWQLPKLEWNNKIDESLRKVILSLFVNVLNVLNQKLIFIFKKQTAERSVNELNVDLKVDFLGNAPAALYKLRLLDQTKGEKHYIFKAQYKAGADMLALEAKIEYAWVRKDELADFIKEKEYLECLNNFILDF